MPEKSSKEIFADNINEVLSKYLIGPNRVNAQNYIKKIYNRLRGLKNKHTRMNPDLSEADRITKAYCCYHSYNNGNKCEMCPYGYSEYNDYYSCKYSDIKIDMLYLLMDAQGVMAVLMFLLEEYSKPDTEKRVIPFKTPEGLAKFLHFLLSIVYHDDFE